MITPSNSNADFDAANLINILTSEGPDQVDSDSDDDDEDDDDDEEEEEDEEDEDEDDDEDDHLGRQSKSGKTLRKARKSLKEFPKSDLSNNYVTLYIHMPNDHFQSKTTKPNHTTHTYTYAYIHYIYIHITYIQIYIYTILYYDSTILRFII